jgi:hypothetical protein
MPPFSTVTRSNRSSFPNHLTLLARIVLIPPTISLDIPASIHAIGLVPFRHCKSLENLCHIWTKLQIKKMDRSTFFLCFSLKSISIPVAVEIICYFCFNQCTSLAIVTLEPNWKVRQIGYAVSCCSSLKSISILFETICWEFPFYLKPICSDCFARGTSLSDVKYCANSDQFVPHYSRGHFDLHPILIFNQQILPSFVCEFLHISEHRLRQFRPCLVDRGKT